MGRFDGLGRKKKTSHNVMFFSNLDFMDIEFWQRDWLDFLLKLIEHILNCKPASVILLLLQQVQYIE